jgi:hypothetical protein
MLSAVLILIGSLVTAAPNTYSNNEALNRTRACVPKDGEAEQLSVSSSAGSADLGQNTVHSVICTVDVYWELGDSAAPTADSSSNYLPADMLMYFSSGSGDQSRYIAAVDVSAASGTCYITECE